MRATTALAAKSKSARNCWSGNQRAPLRVSGKCPAVRIRTCTKTNAVCGRAIRTEILETEGPFSIPESELQNFGFDIRGKLLQLQRTSSHSNFRLQLSKSRLSLGYSVSLLPFAKPKEIDVWEPCTARG